MIDIRISVIIPTYNREKTVERCINSILAQTSSVHEIIVVDDGSTDETVNIVSTIKSELITIVQCEHLGAQVARNAGIRAATGNYIAFLDSDDEWLPNMVEIQKKYLCENPNRVQYTNCILVDEYTNSRSVWNPNSHSGCVYREMLISGGPMFQGLIAAKTAFEEIGYLDENVQAFQEWDTAISLAEKFEFLYIQEPLFIYYRHLNETISKDTMRALNGRQYILDKNRDDIIRYCGYEALTQQYKDLLIYSLEAGGKDFSYHLSRWIEIHKEYNKAFTEEDCIQSLISNLYTQRKNEKRITQLYDRILELKRNKIDIAKLLEQRGYSTIAVYGMNYVGQMVCNELKESNIIVSYGIDRKNIKMEMDLQIINSEDEWPEVDAVIVAAISHFDNIRSQYSDKIEGDIISLEELVYR